MSFPELLAVTAVDNNNGRFFSSLTEASIEGCQNLTHLLAPSLKRLLLKQNSGNLGIDIDCSSLAIMHLSSCDHMASIELQKWSLPALQKLMISSKSLISVRESKPTSTVHSHARNGSGKFPLLADLSFWFCQKLETLDDLLTEEYLRAVKKISFMHCDLLSLPTERFGGFHFLEDLYISECPRLKWQSGIGLLPCSLRDLTLDDCGDFSVLIPGCLQDLTSLEKLDMRSCKGLVSVPGDLWGNLKSLQTLMIQNFPDLVSIGGPTAITNVNKVLINHCWKLREIQQPLYRG